MRKFEGEDSEIVEERMSQGSRYEGSDVGDNLDKESEKLEESNEKKKSTLDLKDPKVMIIGAIAVFVLLAIVVLFVMSKKDDLNGLSEEDLYPDDMVTEEDTFQYTDGEIADLRMAGYTGNEIEQFELDMKDVQELIDEAAAEREAQYEKEMKPLFDGASKEFKRLWNDSWVGQPKLKWSKNSENYEYYSTRMNLDYKKLDATGHQLFIKLTLTDGSFAFMSVTPERYEELKDKGNINVEIDYTQSEDKQYIITAITEVNLY